MDLEDFIPKPVDPNAPKVLDVAAARKMVQQSERFLRQPMGEYLSTMAGQLGCALDALASVDTRVTEAQNEGMRYKQEAEIANAEVRTMQVMVGKAREDLTKALEENKTLKDELAKKAATADEDAARMHHTARKKPGPKAKVVQMQPQTKAAQ